MARDLLHEIFWRVFRFVKVFRLSCTLRFLRAPLYSRTMQLCKQRLGKAEASAKPLKHLRLHTFFINCTGNRLNELHRLSSFSFRIIKMIALRITLKNHPSKIYSKRGNMNITIQIKFSAVHTQWDFFKKLQTSRMVPDEKIFQSVLCHSI